MSDALSQVGPHVVHTPQSEQADRRQVENNSGGWVFEISPEQRFTRFLILGIDSGTYYVKEQKHAKDNAEFVIKALAENPSFVDIIVDVSTHGRAPRQNATLFALAAASASDNIETRRKAFAAVPAVCRTASHLMQYIHYVKTFRGTGRGIRAAIGNWYNAQDAERLAMQLVKYRNRNGLRHSNLLNIAHANITEDRLNMVKWAYNPQRIWGEASQLANPEILLPRMIVGFEMAKNHTRPAQLAGIVKAAKLPWEALPSAALNIPDVWEEMLPFIGMEALVRNLGRLSKISMTEPDSEGQREVTGILTDAARLRASRLHPVKILDAYFVYNQGHGVKGKMTWTPNPAILEALETAFYNSFDNVEPTGARVGLFLDVSGSMGWSSAGSSVMTCAMAAAAMSMVFARKEQNVVIKGFAHELRDLNITAESTIEQAVRAAQLNTFGGTDCAQPMIWAKETKTELDTFICITDNETWFGKTHPHEALRDYRNASGIDAGEIVIGMTSTNFTVSDPSDPRTLDVVGFSTDVPSLVSSFISDGF